MTQTKQIEKEFDHSSYNGYPIFCHDPQLFGGTDTMSR